MNEPKFTPGPWRIVRYCEKIEIANVADILHFYGGETAEANAALIAAAPELFALLKEALEDWDDTNFDEEYPYRIDWADKARAALAKAKGGAE